MSILIKGMEMPTACYECCMYQADIYYCSAAERDIDIPDSSEGRCSFCPLVPVPPHGDLIDRDALSKSLDRLCDRVCQYSKAQRKVMCGACPLGDAFAVVEDDAPTIIPAEEGE